MTKSRWAFPCDTGDHAPDSELAMTALVEPPGRLLTVAEYAELGEDDQCRWELQEGNLVMSPSPSPDHMLTSYEICDQLKAQLPDTVMVIQDVDIDLQLSPRD